LRGTVAFRGRASSGAASDGSGRAAQDVEDERNQGEHHQEMDERSGHVKREEPEGPRDEQDHSNREQHRTSSGLVAGTLPEAPRGQAAWEGELPLSSQARAAVASRKTRRRA